MSNKWGIPLKTEIIVKERDKKCVYCGIEFNSDNNLRKNKPSWEHIVNDIRINGEDNIAICCISCNASKGSKPLEYWLQSSYCKKKNISMDSVSETIKKALKNPPKLEI